MSLSDLRPDMAGEKEDEALRSVDERFADEGSRWNESRPYEERRRSCASPESTDPLRFVSGLRSGDAVAAASTDTLRWRGAARPRELRREESRSRGGLGALARGSHCTARSCCCAASLSFTGGPFGEESRLERGEVLDERLLRNSSADPLRAGGTTRCTSSVARNTLYSSGCTLRSHSMPSTRSNSSSLSLRTRSSPKARCRPRRPRRTCRPPRPRRAALSGSWRPPSAARAPGVPQAWPGT
mmetsp:Transcript_17560/g.42906  ORF Transcript_17560/g.42906 Transcript_17560/m.42906 type:complete len:242 (-) Transcript_17560:475-1200(-)